MANQINQPTKLYGVETLSALAENAEPTAIVEWMLRVKPQFTELDIDGVCSGVVPNAGGNPVLVQNATPADIQLGKRYVLCCIRCPNLKSLLQPLASGPEIMNYLHDNLLGARDKQAIILEQLETMFFDG